MSNDQKPGKMRVVSNAATTRRRTDPAMAVAVAANDAMPGPAVTPGKWSTLLIAILFLTGSALGGAALALISQS